MGRRHGLPPALSFWLGMAFFLSLSHGLRSIVTSEEVRLLRERRLGEVQSVERSVRLAMLSAAESIRGIGSLI